MKDLYQRFVFAIGVLALAGTAFAQVPSTNDTSDQNQNTGMGTSTLGGPAAKNNGSANTASGFFALAVNTTGNANSAFGASALQSNTTGSANTATGVGALLSNTTGEGNTASGASALQSNTTGSANTAIGENALLSNTTGGGNTASGASALQSNTGDGNTASGNQALQNNTNGGGNSAFGMQALQSNATGDDNTASGFQALFSNTTGHKNTATGTSALTDNTTGSLNTASGFGALALNTSGNDNTASGFEALSAATGSNNIAVGYQAGSNLTTGSNNIDIGNRGLAAESDTIRIGTPTQTKTFIAGIFGTSVSGGSAVIVTSNGKLGVTVSSERYKTAIAPMGADTMKLGQLRPVTFHLKTEPHGALQYGLVAEEVAKVYPELVIRDNKGRIYGVRYDELAPMLLNEVQQQQNKMAAQDAKIDTLEHQLAELTHLKQELNAALDKLRAKGELVAQR